jgi:hypothetical protein
VPLKPCAGRCGRLIELGQSRCDACAQGAWREREHGVRASGKRTREWRKLARQVLERDEVCHRCKHASSRYAVHLDGKAANEEGGLDVERIAGMCGTCEAAYRRLLTRR